MLKSQRRATVLQIGLHLNIPVHKRECFRLIDYRANLRTYERQIGVPRMWADYAICRELTAKVPVQK
jgi:hypothetical protein